jgi:hypothetical protein
MTRVRGFILAALAALTLSACVSTGAQPYGVSDSSLRPSAARQATP